MHVKFTDRILWKSYLGIVGIISTFVTLISFFVSIQNHQNWLKIAIFVVFCCSLVLIFLVMWWNANAKKEVKLRINNTNVEIRIGNVLEFNEKEELSVITVNEYFDTKADDYLVAKKSLHGQFIEKMEKERKIKELEEYIKNDNRKHTNTYKINFARKVGNNVKHPIGSMLLFESYVLTTFAKIDRKQQAYLSGEDYIVFLMRFWSNIGSIYAGKTINIPVMGAGITRFRDGKPCNQVLLEMILWSLKLSGFDNSYNDSKVNIIIHENDAEKIDFYHLQHNPNFK